MCYILRYYKEHFRIQIFKKTRPMLYIPITNQSFVVSFCVPPMYIYIESLLNLYSIHGRYNHVRAPLTFIHWEHFEMYKAPEVIDSHAHPMQSLEEI